MKFNKYICIIFNLIALNEKNLKIVVKIIANDFKGKFHTGHQISKFVTFRIQNVKPRKIKFQIFVEFENIQIFFIIEYKYIILYIFL